jgi:hypothetical protein
LYFHFGDYEKPTAFVSQPYCPTALLKTLKHTSHAIKTILSSFLFQAPPPQDNLPKPDPDYPAALLPGMGGVGANKPCAESEF